MGRPKGSSNNNKRGLIARLQREFPGYHAVVEMARLANDENADPVMRFNANKEVAKYITPQLKAVDMSGEVTQKIMTIAQQIQAAENADSEN